MLDKENKERQGVMGNLPLDICDRRCAGREGPWRWCPVSPGTQNIPANRLECSRPCLKDKIPSNGRGVRILTFSTKTLAKYLGWG